MFQIPSEMEFVLDAFFLSLPLCHHRYASYGRSKFQYPVPPLTTRLLAHSLRTSLSLEKRSAELKTELKWDAWRNRGICRRVLILSHHRRRRCTAPYGICTYAVVDALALCVADSYQPFLLTPIVM